MLYAPSPATVFSSETVTELFQFNLPESGIHKAKTEKQVRKLMALNENYWLFSVFQPSIRITCIYIPNFLFYKIEKHK